ncbi:MAG: Hpt domain-containing protein [Phyllobacteriaceae bacterium]|nr:Hpt domain-containing protein [Phyllobacteriaceae bacterium]
MNDVPEVSTAEVAGEETFQARMTELRRRFVERTRRDADLVRTFTSRLERGEPLAGDLLRDLARTAHGLSGAAGVFGFEAISEAAHRLERRVRRLDGDVGDPRPMLATLEAELEALWARADLV